MPRSGRVGGDVEPGYGPVADVFRDQIERRREIGAACAVFIGDDKVVDLWGGLRDRRHRLPWAEHTLVPVFSTTKGLATMALAVAHSRGRLEFDERVATYWPEFAQAGKESITVRQLLSHRSGLAALDERIDLAVLADRKRLVGMLERQRPLWEPGERQGYHAWTLGFYEGELFRRVDPDGRSLGHGFAADVAEPLGLDFHIGLPDEVDDARLATFHGVNPLAGLLHLRDAPRALLLALSNPRSLTNRAFTTLPMVGDPNRINDRSLLRFELAAVGGVGDARSIARAYAEFASGGATLGLTRATTEELEAPAPPPPGGTRDLVLRSELRFSLGFAKPSPGLPLGSDGRAYAMAGVGGSIGMADPALGLGFAYTPNRMGFGTPTDPREVDLRDALYRCLDGPSQRARAPRRH